MNEPIIPKPIIDRYDEMLIEIGIRIYCIPEPGTDFPHLRWMLEQLRTMTDARKAGTWLGFVQGILIERGFTTVKIERDFTRPYFKGP